MTDVLALLIVVPILAAAVTMLLGLRFDRAGWPVAAVTCLAEVGMAGWLGMLVLTGGRRRYELGGFAPPQGIELVGDALSVPVAVLVAVTALSVLIYARRAGPRGTAFYGGYLLLVGGLSGVTLTGDLFNMYVFLEITGLAAYALVASGDSPRSAVAGLKYLILGTIGASLFLLGVGYAFLATGTLNMVDLAERLAAAGYGSRLTLAAFALIVTGLAVKVALFPMHTWQPDAYASAPDSVSAFISALVSTVAAYALARVLYTVFTVEFFRAVPLARDLVVYAAAVSIVAGSVLAVTQSEIKRMLAYSSVSQFGMVVAAFALLNETATVGGVIHLVGHGVMKGGLFAAAGVVAAATGARTVEEYAGLARRAPVAAGSVAVLALAMVGVPPAVGFVGKWYIALGAVESGTWPVAAVILVSTVLTLAYFARVIELMYFAAPRATGRGDSDAGEFDPGRGGLAPTAADGGAAPVSPGMLGVVAGAAVVAVALGLVAAGMESVLEPVLAEVYR